MIIFDFDGTIHKTHKIYYPALKLGVDWLKSQDFLNDFEVTLEKSKKYLGLSPMDAWQKIAPDLEPHVKDEAMRLVGHELKRLMLTGVGELYEGAYEVLNSLKKEGLILLSNSSRDYLNTACRVYDIKKYFTRILAAEEFNFLSKREIIKSLDIGPAFVVGDRFLDVDAANLDDKKSIFCTYGYGANDEGRDADYKIDDIMEILDLIKYEKI